MHTHPRGLTIFTQSVVCGWAFLCIIRLCRAASPLTLISNENKTMMRGNTRTRNVIIIIYKAWRCACQPQRATISQLCLVFLPYKVSPISSCIKPDSGFTCRLLKKFISIWMSKLLEYWVTFLVNYIPQKQNIW